MDVPPSGPAILGTRLRHLLDLLDGDVAAVYADLGLADFRPRFTPVVRVLAASGPRSIRDLARAIGVTHSAASQTVAQMARDGLVSLTPGEDARQRIVGLTPKAEALVPTLEAEWAATAAAAAAFEAELSFPLSRIVDEALEALGRRSMRQRIADAAPGLTAGAALDLAAGRAPAGGEE
ncbi:MarR family winged helix-turn-helix transcriptional regulator [Planobispora longispora]|uniref:MarR family transcriptional regulator n=1 Tax=Planobispora longispora TaxID=28887 RepID=A0A8J3RG83_9ACTN|nr:MarR family transcriptional regulator [Planobispora longispora]GIH74309.1 MarR family transcriptional regulator [Planobispora longispora]